MLQENTRLLDPIIHWSFSYNSTPTNVLFLIHILGLQNMATLKISPQPRFSSRINYSNPSHTDKMLTGQFWTWCRISSPMCWTWGISEPHCYRFLIIHFLDVTINPSICHNNHVCLRDRLELLVLGPYWWLLSDKTVVIIKKRAP